LDLYLVHWPGAGNVPGSSPANADLRAQTWAELEQLQREGLLRAIGVSNYTEQHLLQLLSYCKIPPVLNQVNNNVSFKNLAYNFFY
jgi:diketogulonate reductase-like aldo/keto reductase